MPHVTRTLAAVLVLASVLTLGCGTDEPTGQGPSSSARRDRSADQALVGQALPDLDLTDLQGRKLTNAELKGKVLLIDFWATWCGPCLMAAPVLQALHEQYAGQGLVVLGANVMERGDPAKATERAAAYAAEHRYSYSFAPNADNFGIACGVHALPTMLVVDRQGIVRRVQVGFREGLKKLLEAELKPLLEEPPTPR